jgi:hypothetical protein
MPKPKVSQYVFHWPLNLVSDKDMNVQLRQCQHRHLNHHHCTRRQEQQQQEQQQLTNKDRINNINDGVIAVVWLHMSKWNALDEDPDVEQQYNTNAVNNNNYIKQQQRRQQLQR